MHRTASKDSMEGCGRNFLSLYSRFFLSPSISRHFVHWRTCQFIVFAKNAINYCPRTSQAEYFAHWLLAGWVTRPPSPLGRRLCLRLNSVVGALSEGYHCIVTSFYLCVVAAGPHFRILRKRERDVGISMRKTKSRSI